MEYAACEDRWYEYLAFCKIQFKNEAELKIGALIVERLSTNFNGYGDLFLTNVNLFSDIVLKTLNQLKTLTKTKRLIKMLRSVLISYLF